MRVAFLGLGNMGSGIAGRIVEAGHPLTVWNRTASKTAAMVARGAVPAETIEGAVANSEIVVTSLMDDASVLAATQDSILNALPTNAIHICATTISPDASKQLDQLHMRHGSSYVAGPVIGRPNAAAKGDLVSILAGTTESIEKAALLAKSYSRAIIRLPGDPQRANVFKLCVNYTIISIVELMSEVYTLAEKSDINTQLLVEFYQEWFASPILKMYAEKVATRHFSDGGFAMTGGLKDVRLMLITSNDRDVDFAFGRTIEDKMKEALDGGLHRHDWSAIYEVARARAGLSSILGN